MKIGILSKRKAMLAGSIKEYLENKGHVVSIYTLKNLIIDQNLLDNDLYILKSKNLFFLYAGYFLGANDIPVIPKPQISFMQKNRIQSHFLMKKIGLLTPKIYLGTEDTFKNHLDLKDFPFILKPIMGSGSKGVRIIRSSEDLNPNGKVILYLENYINGIHYNVYFIGNNICTLIKPPLSNEHVNMEKIETPNDIRDIINKWRNYFKGDLLFGHLDIVQEESSNNLFTVDVGSFPQFVNWQIENIPAVETICDLIIKKYEKMKKDHIKN